MRNSHTLASRPCKGLSIIELMVGLTIALFIIAAAVLVSTGQLTDNRRLLLEMQVQQDIRATSDLITRDIRRAGYWAKASQFVNPSSASLQSTAISQAYRTLSPANATDSTSIEYARSQDEELSGSGAVTPENNTLDSNEVAGYRYNATDKTIEMAIGQNNWQTLTDPNILKVTRFAVSTTSTGYAVPCGETCPALGPTGGTLLQCMRNVTIEISGAAAVDSSVKRSIRTRVRLRNDVFTEGTC